MGITDACMLHYVVALVVRLFVQVNVLNTMFLAIHSVSAMLLGVIIISSSVY